MLGAAVQKDVWVPGGVCVCVLPCWVLFLQEWLNIESSSIVWLPLLLWLIIVPAPLDSSTKTTVNDIAVS